MSAPVFGGFSFEKQYFGYPDQHFTVTAVGSNIKIMFAAFQPGNVDTLNTASGAYVTCGLFGSTVGTRPQMNRERFEAGGGNASIFLYSLAVSTPGTYEIKILATTAYSNMNYAGWYVADSGGIGVKAGQNSPTLSSPSNLSLTSSSPDSLIFSLITGVGGGIYSVTQGSLQTQAAYGDASSSPIAFNSTWAISYKVAGTAGSVALSESFMPATAQQVAHILVEVLPLSTTPSNPTPTFPGSMPDINGNVGSSITPVSTAGYFSDPGDTLTYSKSSAGTAWPTWASIDPATGIITGTPTGSAVTTAGCKVRATDTASQPIDSDPFDFIVSASVIGKITSEAFKNWSSNAPLTGLVVPKVSVIRASDMVAVAARANVTTDGTTGQIVVSDAAIIPGTDYLLATYDPVNNLKGLKEYTATL